MAFGQVLARLGVLQIRRVRAIRHLAVARHRTAVTEDSGTRVAAR